MKKRFCWIMAIATLTMLAACAPQKETKTITSKQVVEQTQAALDTLQAYLMQQKLVHEKGAQAELQRLDRRIAILQKKTEKMDPAAKTNLEKQIAAFKSKEDAFKQNLEKMKTGKDQDLEKMMTTLVTGMEELEGEFDKVLEKL